MIKERICSHCGYLGAPKRVTKGSIIIELILWLCLLIPGIIYSVWRLTTRYDACPKCGATNMVPTNSPMGAKLRRELGVPESKDDYYPEKI